MDRDPVFTRVLSVFAQYGYRKTSMSELAEAANVSRQTLYNRFQNKQAVLDWAAEGISRESEALALAALGAEGALADRLAAFFMEWLGVHTTMLHHSAHGTEIFEMCKASHKTAMDQSHERCAAALAQALAGVYGSEVKAVEAAFVLITASKGLMTISADETAYREGIERIIGVML